MTAAVGTGLTRSPAPPSPPDNGFPASEKAFPVSENGFPTWGNAFPTWQKPREAEPTPEPADPAGTPAGFRRCPRELPLPAGENSPKPVSRSEPPNRSAEFQFGANRINSAPRAELEFGAPVRGEGRGEGESGAWLEGPPGHERAGESPAFLPHPNPPPLGEGRGGAARLPGSGGPLIVIDRTGISDERSGQFRNRILLLAGIWN
jgi:hypothetical protein